MVLGTPLQYSKYLVRLTAPLPPRRSEQIALNGLDEYDGGGTFFPCLGRALRPAGGHVLSFRGGILHGGDPLLKGVRYIIACFCYHDQGEGRGVPLDVAAASARGKRWNNSNSSIDGDVAVRGTTEATAAAAVDAHESCGDQTNVSYVVHGGGNSGGGRSTTTSDHINTRTRGVLATGEAGVNGGDVKKEACSDATHGERGRDDADDALSSGGARGKEEEAEVKGIDFRSDQTFAFGFGFG